MQNYTSKTEAGYEGRVHDMDEWVNSCYQILIAVCFVVVVLLECQP